MTVSQKDAAQFFRLMWGLQFFISRERHLLPDVKSLEEYVPLSIARKSVVRNTLWKNPDLIDAYVEKNPDHLPEEELSIIRQWKGFVSGRFTVFRYLKQHTIFIGNSTVYGVLGLFDPLEEVLAAFPLPLFVDAVLLPYKGKIIYDGMLSSYNVLLGPGIRGGLNEEYLTAKQNGRIITSLEAEAAVGQLAPPVRQWDEATAAVLDEIVKMSEKLRGGTALQTAALGVLRASAKAALAAAQQRDDPDPLWRAGRSVQTALNRFYKVLERAEG